MSQIIELHNHRMKHPDITVDPAWRKAAKARAVELGHDVRKYHRSTSFAGHVSDLDNVVAVEHWSATCRGCGLGLVVTHTRVGGPLIMRPCDNRKANRRAAVRLSPSEVDRRAARNRRLGI